jgi:sugar lactone lactonase YvrE
MLSAATLVVLAGAALGPVVTAQAQVVKVLNRDAYFPEGPIWHQGKLYYVEYGRNTVMTWDGRDNAVFASDPGCGQSAVVPTAAGEFLTTCYDNGTIGRMAANGKLLPPYTHDKDGN